MSVSLRFVCTGSAVKKAERDSLSKIGRGCLGGHLFHAGRPVSPRRNKQIFVINDAVFIRNLYAWLRRGRRSRRRGPSDRKETGPAAARHNFLP
jgi:hypothetical protein